MNLTPYLCDKCGKEEPKHALSAFYQKGSSINLGTKHLCTECNDKFMEDFLKYITFLQNVFNNVVKIINKHEHN